jgi:hypothetical protein
LCLTDFIDWRYIHSWLVFSAQLVNCCPHGRRNYTCVLLPLYLLSGLPPPPSQIKAVLYIQTMCGCGGRVGGVELCCRPYSAGVLQSVSDQIQNLQIDSPRQTKMTSKDDIKGLVSLKFLRPCFMEIVATKKR